MEVRIWEKYYICERSVVEETEIEVSTMTQAWSALLQGQMEVE